MAQRLNPPDWQHNAWQAKGNLATNVTGGDFDSDWHILNGLNPWSITVEGTFVADVTILVSNSETPPDDVIDFPVGRQIKAADSFTIDESYRAIKAIVRNWQSGTIRSIDYFVRDRGAQN